MANISKTLMAMYQAMFERFGPRRWWPRAEDASADEAAVEICVGAVLTQNTNWGNVEKAIANLRAAGCVGMKALAALPRGRLAELIRPAGYFNVKAARLGNFVSHVMETTGGDILAFLDRPVGVLREDLLGVSGIGPETADSIILYAAGKPTFVVDAYTCRIMARHAVISPEDGYDAVKEMFESALPDDTALWNEYHALLVAVGKHFCRRSSPRCADCPLEAFPHANDAA